MSVLRSQTLISNPDATIRRREHKWFRITTLCYNLCHTLKIRLLPWTRDYKLMFLTGLYCRLSVTLLSKERVWRSGLSITSFDASTNGVELMIVIDVGNSESFALRLFWHLPSMLKFSDTYPSPGCHLIVSYISTLRRVGYLILLEKPAKTFGPISIQYPCVMVTRGDIGSYIVRMLEGNCVMLI